MRASSNKDLSVFDFNNDEEEVASASQRSLRKFLSRENPKIEESALTKYQFLERFTERNGSQQMGTIGIGFPNGGDPKCSSFMCNDRDSCSVGTSGRGFSTHEATSGMGDILVTDSKNFTESGHANEVNFEPVNLISGCLREDSLAMGILSLEMPSMDDRRLDYTAEELPSDPENLVDVSDDEESLGGCSLSTSASDLQEDGALEPSTSDHCSHGYNGVDNESLEVVVSPDFVLFRDRLYTEPWLTFSSECIRFESSNANGDGEHISYVYAIDDIVSIRCRWTHSVETSWLRIDLKPTAVTEAENVPYTSGLMKLEFSVNGPHWFEKQQRIISLSARYGTLWHVELGDESSREEEYLQRKIEIVSKQCFNWEDEPFEDVIYPKGDPDAVSISKRDVELLKPGTFINDTIIDFYIKYLKDMIQLEDKNRFHFFNSFFFRKLVDLDKNPGSAAESKAAFQRVRKWTRKVNIFEKDYIFVPVNFNLHWSLLVICHPGEVVHFKDDEMSKVHKVPCILHMDSIKGSHKGLKDLVQSYLWEEWRERHKEMDASSEDVSTKFSNMRFVPLELPQQENLYDCGLFLLHYVELFLKEAPVNFSPFRITKFSNFLNKNWFIPAEASAKRFFIQKLIIELHDEHSQTTPATYSDHQLPAEFPETGSAEVAVEFVSEGSNPPDVCLRNSFGSSAERGIEMKLLVTSPSHNVQYDKEAGLVYREFFESGSTIATSNDGQSPAFRNTLQLKCTTTPIEEEAETCEVDAPYSASHEAFCHKTRIMSEASVTATMDSQEQFRGFDIFCVPRISTRQGDNEGMDYLSPDPSSSGSQDSSQKRANECLSPRRSVDIVDPDQLGEEPDKLRSISSENYECVTRSRSVSSRRLENCVVEDSPEDDTMAESKESGDSFFSCQENLATSENGDLPSEYVHFADKDVVPIEKPHAHKRLKLMAVEGER